MTIKRHVIGITTLRCLIRLTMAMAGDTKVYELAHLTAMQVRRNDECHNNCPQAEYKYVTQ